MFIQLFLVCFLVFAQNANATPVGGYVPINDKEMIFSYSPSTMELQRYQDSLYYFQTIFKGTFFQAMQFCKFHGMELVSIESKDENDFLHEALSKFLTAGDYLFWSSGIKVEPDNRWEWMGTGKPISYFNWLAGQPGNTATERYLELRHLNANREIVYNDQVVTQANYAICEVSIPKTINL
ncbi:unnamed protein product [Phyllotreta striolata]|uniref:C-type lectin domain-containing protein n=1 Tax=Phyllotreta striolata TaxID=444603 RepID=A0A9N9TGR8_PHYSR|nr:unnamed protein product [Phyllotreta striolata]